MAVKKKNHFQRSKNLYPEFYELGVEFSFFEKRRIFFSPLFSSSPFPTDQVWGFD